MASVAILGGGMAGFGAAHRLYEEGLPSVIYEKNSYHGGHTASFRNNFGFIFDEGPHISFTQDKRIQQLFAESIGSEYETIYAQVNNYWNDQFWIKHPAQCNLYGLPSELVVKILGDFVQAKTQPYGEIHHYEDWLRSTYGNTFAEVFPMEYGWKYHTTQASNMTTDWLGPRLYQPELEEVLRGAISAHTPDVHYVSHFRYPSKNGFVSYLNGFLAQTDLRLNHRLCRLDSKAKELEFSNGTVMSYDFVLSSLPLPELIALIIDVPSEVKEAVARLACTSCILVNIGLNRQDISDAHWTYFYDRDFLITRLSFPHMLSPHNVPSGQGSIQAELYFSNKYKPLDKQPEEFIPLVIKDLQRCGLLFEEEEVLFAQASLVHYANVIFDLDRAKALSIVHGYLDELEIGYCGRYGEWGYHWTDQAFISGENAAQKKIDRLK